MRRVRTRYFRVHDLLSMEVRASRAEVPRVFEVDGLREPNFRVLEGYFNIDKELLRPLGLRLFVGDRVLLHKCLSYGDLRLLLVDLLGSEGPTVVAFTPQYRLFKEKLMGTSVWHLVKLAIMVRLLASRGMTFVHASGVGKGEEIYLFTAWSDVGKTRTAVELVKTCDELGWVSNDIAILGPKGQVLAWPGFPQEAVRPLEKVLFLRSLTVRKRPLLPLNTKITMRGELSCLFVLEQGPYGAKELEPEEAFRKLFLCTNMAFDFSSNLLLMAYSYANPELDLMALRERHLELLREAVEKAHCVELRARGPRDFARMAQEYIS